MKHRIMAALGIVGLAALGAATALAVSSHDGALTVSCTQATYGYSSFPNHSGNTITEKVKQDGNTITTKTFVFNGPSGSDSIPLTVSGSHSLEATASWNTNGANGNATSGVQHVTCGSTTTTPTTTTTHTTTTTPTTGTTATTPSPPPPSVSISTVTQTTPAPPAPPAPPAVTVTTPAPPVPPMVCPKGTKMVSGKTGAYCLKVVTKWKKCPPVKPKPKPKPKTPYMKCIAGKSNGAFWANGRCYFKGKG